MYKRLVIQIYYLGFKYYGCIVIYFIRNHNKPTYQGYINVKLIQYEKYYI